MTITAAMLDAMVSSGCSAEQIAAVMKAEIAERTAKLEAKRANNNERQRRFRERHAPPAIAEDNADNALQPLDNGDSVTSPLSLSPNEINSNPHTHTPGIKPRARKAAFALPEHIPAEAWDAYLEMRRKIRKPMTDHAKGLAIDELDKLAADGWPPGDVLNHSTLNSYQGLFPPKDRRNGRQQLQPSSDTLRGPRPDPCLDMLREAQAEIRAAEDQGFDRQAWPALPSHRAN